jgi:rRNA-processing protein FCF1
MAEERALLVAELVVVELQKLKRKKRKKRRKKKKLLMWRKSLQPPMCTWEIQSLDSP